MFGKVKKILGIEGVKMELQVPIEISKKSNSISGTIKLSTKTASQISSITLRIIEKYARGRKEARLIDEYVLGELELNENLTITPQEIIEVPFTLEFVNLRSEMDRMADDNIILRGPIQLAKLLKKVNSTYRIEAQASVVGTKLQPFAEINLKIK